MTENKSRQGWSVEFEIDSALRVTETEVEGSEIAAIKRRWLGRIHQKDLALTDHVTVLPERKRASAVVLFVRDALTRLRRSQA
jgi:hypothetical protein